MKLPDRPLLVSQAKAAKILGVSMSKFIDLVKAGVVKTVTLTEGGHPMVPYAALEALVNGEKP